MILTLGQTAEDITVTLNEKRTLTVGYYLLVFTHYTTKEVVTKIYNFLDDASPHPERYNQFEINTASVFASRPTGQWVYKIYEQASASNTDPTGLTEVEQGIMVLKPVTAFQYNQYNQATAYKIYQPAMAGIFTGVFNNVFS